MQGVHRSSSEKRDTAASIGSVATLPKNAPARPVGWRRICLYPRKLTLAGADHWDSPKPLYGKDGERMANRVRNIVLRVPVTAQEREMIELKMQQMGTRCIPSMASSKSSFGNTMQSSRTLTAFCTLPVGANRKRRCSRSDNHTLFTNNLMCNCRSQLDNDTLFLYNIMCSSRK